MLTPAQARDMCKSNPRVLADLERKLSGLSSPKPAARRSKYNAKRAGGGFDSKAERSYYEETLLPLAKAKQILSLEVHKRFPLDVAGIHVCEYEADFTYTDQDGALHVVDVKGDLTAAAFRLFWLKRRLMLACHNILIAVVYRGKELSESQLKEEIARQNKRARDRAKARKPAVHRRRKGRRR